MEAHTLGDPFIGFYIYYYKDFIINPNLPNPRKLGSIDINNKPKKDMVLP